MIRFTTLSFLLLWPTGYLVAILALTGAGPTTFLAFRYGAGAVVMAAIALALRVSWPSRLRDAGHCAVVGMLIHGVGLGGVWVAIDLGVEAGVSALIMGLQPVLTAALAVALLGEHVDRLARAGLALGLAGIVLVVHARLSSGVGTGAGLAVNGVAVVALTSGTLYQKRFCGSLNLMAGNAIQLAAAAVLLGVGAWLLDDVPFTWTGPVVFSLAWSVLVLSIGATLALYYLLRRGAATSVASLFYLVPPLTAVMAWLGFGEALAPLTIAGMALTTVGVAMVITPRAKRRA